MKKLFERLTLPVFLIILTEIGCAFFATTSESEQMNSSTLGVPLTMYLGAILFAWYSAWNLLYIAFRQRRRVNVSKLLPDETAALVEGIIYLGSSIGNTYLLHKCYVQRHDLQLAEHASNIMMWVRSDYITLVIWVVVLIPVLIVSFSAKSEDKVNLFRIFAIMLIGVPQLLAAQQIYCYWFAGLTLRYLWITYVDIAARLAFNYYLYKNGTNQEKREKAKTVVFNEFFNTLTWGCMIIAAYLSIHFHH